MNAASAVARRNRCQSPYDKTAMMMRITAASPSINVPDLLENERIPTTTRYRYLITFDLETAPSMNRPCLAIHVIHQQILPQRVRRRKIRLSTAQLRDLLDEVH